MFNFKFSTRYRGKTEKIILKFRDLHILKSFFSELNFVNFCIVLNRFVSLGLKEFRGIILLYFIIERIKV